MDIYEAREYLSRLSDVNADIQRNMAIINELRSTLNCTGGMNTGDRVKSSARGDKIESMVAKLIEYEERTNKLLAKYDVMRKERVSKIKDACRPNEAEVLINFYVRRLTNKEIAFRTNTSESTVHRRHKNGLKRFAEKFF